MLGCADGQTCGWDGTCEGGGGGWAPDACSECLDTCHGLPGCCTGEGCMCDDEC